jgi:hypothetical protein
MCANWFLDTHLKMKYKGKSDGKTETAEGKIYANCNKCRIPLELFEGGTQFGNYVVGVCHICKSEIDFTDVGKW